MVGTVYHGYQRLRSVYKISVRFTVRHGSWYHQVKVVAMILRCAAEVHQFQMKVIIIQEF